MKIVLAGGTGFLGSPLCEAWAEDGHDVRVLTRSLPEGQSQHDSGTGVPGITRVGWRPDGTAGALATAVESADAVINLAGESIGTGRWTASRLRALRDSRVLATRSLAAALPPRPRRHALFVSGSAIGYYGDTRDAAVTEHVARGIRISSRDLCVEWEAEAQRVARPDVRVVTAAHRASCSSDPADRCRSMVRPFRFFVGGRLGSGRQYFSWIHRLDWIEMVRWIVETPTLSGPINATAPDPVTNAQFTRALGRALHRPALLPAPALRPAPRCSAGWPTPSSPDNA